MRDIGMCTEPAAFDARCVWHADDLPFAEPVITDNAQVADLRIPDPRKDGLCPRMIERIEECFPSIEGILLLDDIVGFIGPDDFKQHAMPNLKSIYESFEAKVKFFHNDAAGQASAPFLPEIGINLFNFAFDHGLGEMKEWTGGEVALLGNIPPRDVLAEGRPEDVRSAVEEALDSVEDKSRIILSCGGGMPPGVSTDNIRAFQDAVR